MPGSRSLPCASLPSACCSRWVSATPTPCMGQHPGGEKPPPHIWAPRSPSGRGAAVRCCAAGMGWRCPDAEIRSQGDLLVGRVGFLQFRMKIMNKQLERFGNRVEFTGNPTKNDVSFTLNNVQLEDQGTYNCYVLNPPDRQRGHASISLKVLTEEPPKRDSTVAVIVGASVGGFLAVVILVLMVVKCVRRKKQQRLNTDDQKTEEEGKTDGEGNPEEGTK
uniref:Sodium voltage-gated channel beta subunit 2 n=1 Tax=Gallus gallus TaxID=9031 RepID=A0A8V1A1B4_CHICK